MVNALMIDERDDVVVAIEPIAAGETVSFQLKDTTIRSLIAANDITIYHKVAIKDIRKGSKVTKYGEHMGEAMLDIQKGEHVHVHNVVGVREDLEF